MAMKIVMGRTAFLLCGAVAASGAAGDDILVLLPQFGAGGPGYFLGQLGHNVTSTKTPPLSYAGYDQVWDMRYDENLTNTDITAMGAYLQSGGRMYLTGEHAGYDPLRNNSLAAWISAVGGGTVGTGNYENRVYDQYFTTKGQKLVNKPNTLASIRFNASSSFDPTGISQGFAVTADPNDGRTSLIGWNLGDITGAPNARMLICWDVNVFDFADDAEGKAFTENFYHYLAVPAPSGGGLLVFAGIATSRRRR